MKEPSLRDGFPTTLNRSSLGLGVENTCVPREHEFNALVMDCGLHDYPAVISLRGEATISRAE
jgi:hypothetical protein